MKTREFLEPLEKPDWLDQFERSSGRPLRVLHLGNIANNGFINAKIMREVGIDAHCVCYDYYHVMGTPEWEDADFVGSIGDPFYPDWWRVNKKEYKRPDWYHQGPKEICRQSVIAQLGDDAERQKITKFIAELSTNFVCFASSGNFRWSASPLKWPSVAIRGVQFLYYILKVTLRDPKTAYKAVLSTDSSQYKFSKFLFVFLNTLRVLFLTVQFVFVLPIVLLVLAISSILKPKLYQMMRKFLSKFLSKNWRFFSNSIINVRHSFRLFLRSSLHRFTSKTFIEITGMAYGDFTAKYFGWKTKRPNRPNDISFDDIYFFAQYATEPKKFSNIEPTDDGWEAEKRREETHRKNFSQTFFPVIETIYEKTSCNAYWRKEHLRKHVTASDVSEADLQGDFAFAGDLAAGWSKILKHFDIVQCYAVDGIIPMALQWPNYFCYEHGTIRQIPFTNTEIGRLTASCYQNSTASMVTNLDNLEKADELGIEGEQLVCLPHALDDSRLLTARNKHLRLVPSSKDVVTFFSPSRHDWQKHDPNYSKGNDLFLRAASRIKDEGADFKLLLVEWGRDAEKSKKLIHELGLTNLVEWVKPMKKQKLWETYFRSHAVVDQFVIPAFGSVTFEALALGRPVITRVDIPLAERFFGVAPPILNCATVSEITVKMREVLEDPEDSREVGQASFDWAKKYHSSNRVLKLQLEAYRKSLGL